MTVCPDRLTLYLVAGRDSIVQDYLWGTGRAKQTSKTSVKELTGISWVTVGKIAERLVVEKHAKTTSYQYTEPIVGQAGVLVSVNQ